METLGTSDIAQLYNTEKRQILNERIDAKKQSIEQMNRYMIMQQEEIDRFATKCDELMYLAIARLKNKYYGTSEDNHTWIGIDPSGTTLETLWEKTKNLGGRYCFTISDNMAFSVEQNTKNGIRPHVHMMIRGVINQRPAYIAKRLAEYYDCAPNFIDVKHYRRKQLYEEHLNYIQGIKQEEKMPQVQLDIIDREALGIPHFKLFS